MLARCKCFPIIACCVLGILFIYGTVGIVFNSIGISQGSDEYGSPWPINPGPIQGVLIVIQCFFILTMFFGILGLWKRERNCYFTACFIILGMFAVLVVFGIVCIRTSQKNLAPDIMKSLTKNVRKKESIQWFYDIQFKHKCCGVSNYSSDWIELIRVAIDAKYKLLEKASLPHSCCKQSESMPPADNCGFKILPLNDTTLKTIYTKPCSPKISIGAKENLMTYGIEMMILSLACLIISGFLYCGATEMLCMKGHFNDRRKSKKVSAGSTRGIMMDDFDLEDEDLNKTASNTRGARIDSQGNLAEHTRSKIKGSRGSKGKGDSAVQTTSKNDRPSVTFETPEIGAGKVGTSTPPTKKAAKGRIPKSGQILKKQVNGIKEPGNNNHKELKKITSKNPIDTRKTQISRPNRTSWKWKGNSRVDSKALLLESNNKPTFSQSRSALTRDDIMLRKKLEMLYDGVDKNVSTLSTTPNPSGSISFPWSLVNTRTATASRTSGANNAKTTPRGKDKVTTNERPLFTSLSHYSSLPLFHLVKFPNGELGTLGQYSPHFVTHGHHERHTHRYFYTPPPPSAFGSPNSKPGRSTMPIIAAPCIVETSKVNEEPIQQEGTNLNNEDCTGTSTGVKISLSGSLDPPENNNESNPSVYPSRASTSVRSTTLATIQEESESLKSTPVGASPASPSPTGPGTESPNVANMFGGSFINDLSTVISLHIPASSIDLNDPRIQQGFQEEIAKEAGEEEEVQPLKAVGTGEFVVESTVSKTNSESKDESAEGITNTVGVTTVIEINPGDQFQNQCLKSDEFDNEQTDKIEEAIAEIGALAKARASKAQIRLGFD